MSSDEQPQKKHQHRQDNQLDCPGDDLSPTTVYELKSDEQLKQFEERHDSATLAGQNPPPNESEESDDTEPSDSEDQSLHTQADKSSEQQKGAITKYGAQHAKSKHIDSIADQKEPNLQKNVPLEIAGEHLQSYVAMRKYAGIAVFALATGIILFAGYLIHKTIVAFQFSAVADITKEGVYAYLAYMLGKAVAISAALTVAYKLFKIGERMFLPLVNSDVVDLKLLQGTTEKKKSLRDVLADTVAGKIKEGDLLKSILNIDDEKNDKKK